MCGIAGVMTKNGGKVDKALLVKFSASLAHRGPDGCGQFIHHDVGFIQTRLAIIDLETGNQPIYYPNEEHADYVLAANGEVYNYIELREELTEVLEEDIFSTNSDCEPPLHLYRRMGVEFSSKLRGMYAIAIYDKLKDHVILTRDRFGIKPLYYVETPELFAFASELHTFIDAGIISAEVEDGKAFEMLQMQFTTGDSTIFKGVKRVMPGEILVIKDGHIIDRSRIDALDYDSGEVKSNPARTRLKEEDAIRKLDKVLLESVEMHQRSDVPFGMFLSGGVDSAVILSLMSRLNQHPVLAFTAGFPNTLAHDEREHARYLAKSVGAEHVEVTFTEDDFWNMLPEVVKAMDDPAADYAILPTYKLAVEAKKHVKVILSGEGGDEMFAGYGRYRSANKPWPFAKKMRRKGTFDALGIGVLKHQYVGSKHWRDGLASVEHNIYASNKLRDGHDKLSKLQIAQAVDCADWLPNDLLCKLDRCLMRNALEGRVPFLDNHVSSFANNLPDDMKVQGRMGKWILRRWLEEKMPEAKPFSKKRGFTVPVGEWISNSHNNKHLAELIAKNEGIQTFFNKDKIENVLKSKNKKIGFAAWTLLFYALWHKIHVSGCDCNGNIFEVLDA
ncbi:MAG: asparagine synthase (glutamine-hydrolyzing) [Alphaproteobacteria bacterium]|nr:asparagine synthase (glutamine-hydrolyzing) [Alphaproteobacteria bacterium]